MEPSTTHTFFILKLLLKLWYEWALFPTYEFIRQVGKPCNLDKLLSLPLWTWWSKRSPSIKNHNQAHCLKLKTFEEKEVTQILFLTCEIFNNIETVILSSSSIINKFCCSRKHDLWSLAVFSSSFNWECKDSFSISKNLFLFFKTMLNLITSWKSICKASKASSNSW